MTAIKINNLSISYGKHPALQDLSLTLPTGSMTGVLGPNGAGKSTLIKSMAGVITNNQGSILIQNKPITSLSRKQLAKLLSYTPQINLTDISITVKEFVSFGRYPHLGLFPIMKTQDYHTIETALKETDLLLLKDKNLTELSGGEKQRALLARALATEAPILLFDEPFNGLDLKHTLEFINLLNRFASQGKTVVISVHDINLALENCPQIILLNDGHIKRHSASNDTNILVDIEAVFQVKIEKNQSLKFKPN